MPTRVSVTYNWVGIYSSMSIDPIVYIDGNGILFTGTMDIHKYVMYGVYGLVGLTVIVFTCCCCFCKCCPVYKSRTAFMMKRAQRRTCPCRLPGMCVGGGGGGRGEGRAGVVVTRDDAVAHAATMGARCVWVWVTSLKLCASGRHGLPGRVCVCHSNPERQWTRTSGYRGPVCASGVGVHRTRGKSMLPEVASASPLSCAGIAQARSEAGEATPMHRRWTWTPRGRWTRTACSTTAHQQVAGTASSAPPAWSL